ncbi:hypothetical protein Pmani_004879 [Petrolisthes manimaculis]|uniref:Uncharacterized protein n=1 Tax=Petrolisthes manimaculis TaxID=1843537 RepID=A0AAE1QFU7_9EUCA|nr:hypothetical protein Pmani_004879 [Petrolisthes manimaculis]
MKKDIRKLKKDIRKLKKDIRKLEKDIRKLKKDIRKLEKDIRKLEKDIRKLEKDIRKLERIRVATKMIPVYCTVLYAPQQRRPNEEKEEFREKLSDRISEVSRGDIVIVAGDMNVYSLGLE